MKNRHGFVNMVPDAKMLHPYIGFSGYHGYPTFQTGVSPNYSSDFCRIFTEEARVFTHSVKMFFPEIKHGVLSVDSLHYSIDKSDEDDVTVTSRVVLDGKYEEYAVINDFTAEFDVEITVSFGERGSLLHPAEVYCDFIDVYVHNQRISLTVHDNNLLFIPYAMSYRTEFPPEVARLDSKSTNLVANTDLSYGFVLNKTSMEKMKEKGFSSAKLDSILLDTKKKVMNVTNKQVGGGDGFGLGIADVMDVHTGVSEKYVLLLPQSIFPDRMELTGLPIFNSEKNMKCCEYREAGWCTPYFEIYDVESIYPECPPAECRNEICKDTPQYEVRNKVIDGYLILADKTWEELDDLAGVLNKEKRLRDIAKQDIIVEEE